jgi:DNA (cytosine-5)-methyltransferase 1
MNKPVSDPMPTVVTAPNVSLVTPTKRPKIEVTPEQIDAVDVSEFRFRMLQWREHANAQRFPREYIFTGNSSVNTLLAGNAVASNVAHYLGMLARVALGDATIDALGLDYIEEVAA